LDPDRIAESNAASPKAEVKTRHSHIRADLFRDSLAVHCSHSACLAFSGFNFTATMVDGNGAWLATDLASGTGPSASIFSSRPNC